MEYKVVILTMSSKNKGYCVAGINTLDGKLIRLVSDDIKSCGALNSDHIKYQNGGCCTPLDVVRVPIIKCNPLASQPENILIDTNKKWTKEDGILLKDVLTKHPPESPDFLFGNQDSRLTEEEIKTVKYSLILVKVADLMITHPQPKRTKASFIYNNIEYTNISVTDPCYYEEEKYYINEAILVMSLPASSYNGYYYKFVAKIFPLL